MPEDLCCLGMIPKDLKELNKGKENLWSPMKKRKLLTWKSTGKKAKVAVNKKLVELQEDRSLFARMMMVCRSRPEINIEESIGMYEFSLVPRSLFAADGTMLHCSNKSALMSLIEGEAPAAASSGVTTDIRVEDAGNKIAMHGRWHGRASITQ